MRIGYVVASVLVGSAVFAAIPGCSSDKPHAAEMSGKSAAALSEFKDERALTELKVMSDVLAKATSLKFRADTSTAIASPTGQWVHVFSNASVFAQRPDKLYVETRGDAFAQNFYFDGKTVAMYAPTEKLYATEAISGKLDETLTQVFEKHGTYFSFVDVILSVPHKAMISDVTSAQLVGKSTVGGVATTHLAFTSPGMEWEIWIGVDDRLPRLLSVTYTGEKGQPTCSVAFSEWQLNSIIAADKFTFTPPAGAARIEFKKLEMQNGNNK